MSKMRIYELAKELGKDNKEIVDYMLKKGVDVKSHMSMLEDEHVAMARQEIKPTPVQPKAAEPKAQPKEEGAADENGEAPKKKNISMVFRSQNSRTGIQRPANKRPAGGRQTGADRKSVV